jgi:prepilin-type N-terminal cleavage/methylation domain-containing protein
MKLYSQVPVRSGSVPGESGFTLIEVMVSMVVLGGLACSAFYILSSQSGMGSRSNDMLKGVNLGKLAMDSLKVAAYDHLEAGSDTVGDRYIRSWRVTLSTDGHGVPNGRKRIDLTVHWPLTAEHSVAFASVKSDGRFKEER